MSDANRTCEYVLDPDDPETWGGEEGDECYVDDEVLNEDNVWSCPHEARDDNLCVFHQPIDDKDEREAVKAFLDILNNVADSNDSETQKPKFLGAKFGTFDLRAVASDSTFDTTSINLSHAVVEGELDWSQLTFDVSAVRLDGAQVVKDASFYETAFKGNLTCENATFGGETSFRSAEFGKRTTFSEAKFRSMAEFRAANFAGDARFETVTFHGKADISAAKFEGEAHFKTAEFATDVQFTGARFREKTDFNHVTVEGDTDFIDTRFDGRAIFVCSNLGGEVDFQQAEFRDESFFGASKFHSGKADFRNTTFRGYSSFEEGEFLVETEFIGAEFNKSVYFGEATFDTGVNFVDVEFDGEVNFEEVKFGGEAVFGRAEFTDQVTFKKVEFGGRANFERAEFKDKVDFRGRFLERANFQSVDATDAMFSDTTLTNANLEEALLSRATLFGADLRGARLGGALLGDVRIDDETKFLGHPSDGSMSQHTVAAIRSRLCCVYDPAYDGKSSYTDVDTAKSVYRMLEDLGGKHARPRLQARSFVRRQDLQKDEYKRDAKGADSWEERLIAGARWSRARVARTTLLYGESPWRVIGWSLGIIISFALLYPLGGWMKPTDGDPITYAQIASNPVEILNSVYYSTLTYTALGFGDFKPVGLGKALTTVETGLGAVMLALLVFILGRRAAR